MLLERRDPRIAALIKQAREGGIPRMVTETLDVIGERCTDSFWGGNYDMCTYHEVRYFLAGLIVTKVYRSSQPEERPLGYFVQYCSKDVFVMSLSGKIKRYVPGDWEDQLKALFKDLPRKREENKRQALREKARALGL